VIESGKRSFVKRLAGIVGGLVLFYLLGLGPLFVLLHYRIIPENWAPMNNAYLLPAVWIAHVPVVRSLMDSYIDVWLRITNAPDTTP
jgi:hypothetical protein